MEGNKINDPEAQKAQLEIVGQIARESRKSIDQLNDFRNSFGEDDPKVLELATKLQDLIDSANGWLPDSDGKVHQMGAGDASGERADWVEEAKS